MNFRHVTILTDILLLDIVGYSKLPDSVQYHCIQIIQDLSKQHLEILGRRLPKDMKLVIGFIPTGDGFYFILNPAVAGYGPLLALALRNAFHVSKESIRNFYEGVRVAAHSGTAIPFRDINRQMNFVGSGLNDAARLLSPNEKTVAEAVAFAADKSFVVASGIAMKHFFEAYGQQHEWLRSFAFRHSGPNRFRDKHEKEHTLHFIESDRKVAILAPPDIRISSGELMRMTEIFREFE
jgi:hypothetical protein